MADVRIGCSGFNYSHWKEKFYPKGLSQRKWFEYYCTIFRTVELNVTFYRLPKESTFDKWYQETPPHFVFALKGSRYITHVKRLSDPKDSVALFFKGALRLKKKLKAVLWQFPPSFQINRNRLIEFLGLLKKYPVENILEFRHESWIKDDIFELCGAYHAGLCMADSPDFLDELPVTSDCVYIRRHGRGGRYDSCYTKDELKRDAKRIKGYANKGKKVFMYFNNDAFGYAPKNARSLIALLQLNKAGK
jgi:uncharacterized protein YecE (DUF72 family)